MGFWTKFVTIISDYFVLCWVGGGGLYFFDFFPNLLSLIPNNRSIREFPHFSTVRKSLRTSKHMKKYDIYTVKDIVGNYCQRFFIYKTLILLKRHPEYRFMFYNIFIYQYCIQSLLISTNLSRGFQGKLVLTMLMAVSTSQNLLTQ